MKQGNNVIMEMSVCGSKERFEGCQETEVVAEVPGRVCAVRMAKRWTRALACGGWKRGVPSMNAGEDCPKGWNCNSR